MAPATLSPPVGGTQRPAHVLHSTHEGDPTAAADSSGIRWHIYRKPWTCFFIKSLVRSENNILEHFNNAGTVFFLRQCKLLKKI